MEPAVESVGSNKLPRGRRIARRADFLAIQGQGRKLSAGHFLALVRPRRSGATRLGLTVSRKVGNAVTRNRVKRWIREGYRRMQETFPAGVDLVLIARPSSARAGLAATIADLRALADRMRRA